VPEDPALALVADECDLRTGRWDQRFRRYLHDDPAGKGTAWLRLAPSSLVASDLSCTA
jgi:hypothetical protein